MEKPIGKDIRMQRNTILTLAIFLPISTFASDPMAPETLFSYQDFTSDLDVTSLEPHDQSRVWSTCAVVHDLVALFDKEGLESPSAQESKNQSRGAKLASWMVFVADYLKSSEDPSPAEFSAKWQMGKMIMDSNFETTKTSIVADLDGNPEETLKKIVPTYQYCLNVLPVQQTYIDLWREMYGSGLVQSDS